MTATGQTAAGKRPQSALRGRGRATFSAWSRPLGLAIGAMGVLMLAAGAYVPAKAWLGQQMLRAAFAEAQANGAGAKPWVWADFTAVARISAPRLGAEAVALNASTGAAMAWGPGAVPGLDQPNAGLVAFAGHRDTHFAFLGDLRPDDELRLEGVDGVRRSYRVTGAAVVDSRHWRFPTEGEGLMLLTCWPLNAQTPGPLRFVITAEQAATPL